MYKLVKVNGDPNGCLLRMSDNAYIPFDSSNSDYQTYLKWLDGYEWKMVEPMKMEWVKTSEGNQPLPADS